MPHSATASLAKPGERPQRSGHLRGLSSIAKDRHGLLLPGDPAFARCGAFPREEGLVDRTDDGIVALTGKPQLGIVALAPIAEGFTEWFVTN